MINFLSFISHLPRKTGKMRVEEFMRQAFTFCAVLLLPFACLPASVAAPRSTGEVVIINTGDRVTPGYRVTVEPNGTLASVLVPTGRRKPIRQTNKMIVLTRRRFFADLANAGPLGSLPAAGMGSAPAVYVRYRGQQSPNLRAAGSTSGQMLYQDVKQILQVLRLPIPDVP